MTVITLRLTALALYSVQKTILSSQRAPPTTVMYIPTRLWLHACISRHFWWQSSIVAFIPSELVMSAPTRVSV